MELRRPEITLLEAQIIDPTHLELKEPIDLPAGRNLVLSVVEVDEDADDHPGWRALSAKGLAAAYDDAEAEYSLDLLREPNPEFAK